MTALPKDVAYYPPGSAAGSFPLDSGDIGSWGLGMQRLAWPRVPDEGEDTWFGVTNRQLAPTGARCIVVNKMHHEDSRRSTMTPIPESIALVRSTLGLNIR